MFDRYAQATAPSWGRRALIIASITLHGGAAVALAIYSIFHVEEITPPAISLTFFSAPPPPPPPPPAAHKKTTEHKIVPKTIVQTPTSTIKVFEKPKEPEPDDNDSDTDGPPDGQVGGVKNGVPNGTVGGTGTAPVTKAAPKMVASFTLKAMELGHELPHLTDDFKSKHPQQTVRGMYKVCVDTDGKVMDVTPLTAIGGMDATIIQQIRSGWTYKPQPLPFCTVYPIVFKIN